MSVNNFIFSFLQTASVVSMGILGWKNGKYIKNITNHPPIDEYKNKLLSFYGDRNLEYITEETFCKISGSFVGMIIGRALWPVCIPGALMYIEMNHKEDIRKIFRKL